MTLSEKLYDYNTHLTNDDRSEIADHIEALEKTDGKAELFIDGIKFVATDYDDKWYVYFEEPKFNGLAGAWDGKFKYLSENSCPFVDYETSLIELSLIKVR